MDNQSIRKIGEKWIDEVAGVILYRISFWFQGDKSEKDDIRVACVVVLRRYTVLHHSPPIY